MSESVSWNPNTNCRRKLFIYVVPHIIVTKAKVLNFNVGEGTIADGKKVWTSVLVDAVEGVTVHVKYACILLHSFSDKNRESCRIK